MHSFAHPCAKGNKKFSITTLGNPSHYFRIIAAYFPALRKLFFLIKTSSLKKSTFALEFFAQIWFLL